MPINILTLTWDEVTYFIETNLEFWTFNINCDTAQSSISGYYELLFYSVAILIKIKKLQLNYIKQRQELI